MNDSSRSNSVGEAPRNLGELCSLEPDALVGRLSMIRREISPHVRSTQKLGNGIAWDFDATPEMRTKLENLARLERECCGSLDFEIWENPSGSRLRFEISGADLDPGSFDASSVADPFGHQMEISVPQPADGSEPASRWWPIAKRGGIALTASFVVCCVLPFAVLSIAGITVAAPLMKLDNPLTIGALALLFGALFWFYEKRRAATATATALSASSNEQCGC